MKLDMELKPGDVVLLKLLSSVLIFVLIGRFLILPGIEKHQNLVLEREQTEERKQEMEDTIANAPLVEQQIEQQQKELKTVSEPYYGSMGNQEVDELVTGLILSHNLFPVSLSIGDTYGEVPAAYFLSQRAIQAENAAAAAAAAAEAAAGEDGTDSSDGDTADSAADVSALTQVEYTKITPVTVSIRGTGEEIRAFLDDIALNYPGIQVRSFDMQKGTYVNDALQIVGSTDAACTLHVYSCTDEGAAGEETNQ